MSFDEWWSRIADRDPVEHTYEGWAKLGWDAALKKQWQPIENCPIETDVFCVENGRIFRSVFVFDGTHWYDSDNYIAYGFKPSHFMLIPEPPK